MSYKGPAIEHLLTTIQVAELLAVHRNTVRRWAEEGQIDSILLPGGHHRYREADVLRMLGRAPVPDTEGATA
jgi:excisionase family DNA binding protein